MQDVVDDRVATGRLRLAQEVVEDLRHVLLGLELELRELADQERDDVVCKELADQLIDLVGVGLAGRGIAIQDGLDLQQTLGGVLGGLLGGASLRTGELLQRGGRRRHEVARLFLGSTEAQGTEHLVVRAISERESERGRGGAGERHEREAAVAAAAEAADEREAASK